MSDNTFRALYYPFSRTLDETTLKRAVLLYDEILFVDPVSERVRDGLFDEANHASYLPANLAPSLSGEWQAIKGKYDLLQSEGLLRLIDPTSAVQDDATGSLIASALRADISDTQLQQVFDERYPRAWSMLRSRIPQRAFESLVPQIPARVLGEHPYLDGRSLFIDGNPRSTPAIEPQMLPDDQREYAAVLPYLAGSSLATSTAIALALSQDAVPLTDSDAHFRLLSARMARAAQTATLFDSVPGLRPSPAELQAQAQKNALVQWKVVDSVVSHQDLDALSFEDCLRYREGTAVEREQFRKYLSDIASATRSQPWSADLAAHIDDCVQAATREVAEHQKAMRAKYRTMFKRAIGSLVPTLAPAVVSMAFPWVSPLMALLFGGGQPSGVADESVQLLVDHWADRDTKTSSLAYLMELPTA